MGHGDVKFHRRQGPRQRRVRISVNQDHVGPLADHHPFQRFHHAAGHGPVDQPPDAQMILGPGNVELLKKDVRHLAVVVLPRVDDDLADLRPCGHDSRDRSRLDELGTGAHHRKNELA